jgi:hypothetical protein
MAKKNPNIEYRSLRLDAVAEEEKMLVRGYATTFNQPYLLYENEDEIVYEQVDANAFADADMSDVIMQYDHEGRVFARMRNNTLTVEPDEKGLLIEADLGGTELGRGLYEEIRGGYTDKMSFGFTISTDEVESRDSEDGREEFLRTITGIKKLYDVSAVSLPANEGTSISARSLDLIDGEIERIRAERLEAERLETERRRALVRARALMEVNRNDD